jgi:hypothetical protein
MGEQDLDYRRVADRGEAKELSDLVEHSLGGLLDLLRGLSKAVKPRRWRDEHPSEVCVGRLRREAIGSAAVD